jgi:hypothetical protein
MNGVFSIVAAVLLKTGLALIIANEIRGLIMAVPILYGMYAAGGTMMAVWLGFCSLAGIALSVAVPLFIGKKLKLV